MKILFAGSGAMGARFGWMLSQSGQDVWFADQWKEHIEAINTHGLKVIIDKEDHGNFRIPACEPKAVQGAFDVVFVFTKALGLDAMMKDIQHVLTSDTRVICLLNGLGNVEVIEQYVPKQNIYLGVTLWSSGLGGAGIVDAVGTGSIELQQIAVSDDAFNGVLLETLNNAGLHAAYSENVWQSVWHKVALNCVLNAYCTLIDCNIAQFGAYPERDALIALVVDEVVKVGIAEGVNVKKDIILDKISFIFAPEQAGAHYPSLYQDMKNHRRTEIDYLNGAIARLGKKNKIATPVNEAITLMIHCKEHVVNAQ